jgi:quercetin dioxygenase-like cupin family protein
MKELPLIRSDQTKILNLLEEVQFVENGIASRNLLATPHGRVVLFGFSEGEELTEHTSTSHAIVQILAGECSFSLEGEWKTMKAGDFLHMPPNLKHAVKATKAFSMLLTLIKPVVVS